MHRSFHCHNKDNVSKHLTNHLKEKAILLINHNKFQITNALIFKKTLNVSIDIFFFPLSLWNRISIYSIINESSHNQTLLGEYTSGLKAWNDKKMAMNVNNSFKITWVKVVIVMELLHASYLLSNETWRSHTQPHLD